MEKDRFPGKGGVVISGRHTATECPIRGNGD